MFGWNGIARSPTSRGAGKRVVSCSRATCASSFPRHGARAEEIAREHARISRANLDLVLENREILEQLPGGPLLKVV